MDDKSFTVRVPKRWVRIAMIVGVTALIVAPLTAIASHSFTDVPDSNTFHEDIAWLADADVTKGCNPSQGNTEFCPSDNVSRGQMAAFMRRFAQYIDAEDGTPAQADSAANADNAANAANAANADNADTLDGLEATDFQNSVLIATDSADVNMPGGATTQVQSLTLPPGAYFLSATGVLNNNAGSEQSANCTLSAGGESVTVMPTADIVLGSNVAAGDKEDVTVFLVAELDSTGTASLDCTTSAGFLGNIGGPQIVAMSVDSADVTVTGSASGSGGNGDG